MNAHPDHIAYLVPRFPDLTHAFFWREVRALRDAGTIVDLVSTLPPRKRFASEGEHPFAGEATRQTHYLGSDRTAGMAWLAAHPQALARGFAYLGSLRESGTWEKLAALALFPASANLCRLASLRGFDRVHIHSCANAAHLGALANRFAGLDYSLTLHGDLPVYGKDHAQKMAGARFISTVTRPLREQVQQVTGRSEKSVPVVTMGVDTDRFRPNHKGLFIAGPLRMLTVSRLIPQKGHADAIEALGQLANDGVDFHYTIAGDGPELPRLRRLVRSAGLENRISFPGRLGEDEVLAMLRKSDVFLLPSFGLGEAAPVSVMEAMACGLGVVCSRIGGTPDMITDGVDGLLVPQRSPGRLAAALRDLAFHRAQLIRLGKAARLTAVKCFDYRATASQLADCLSYPVRRTESAALPFILTQATES